MAKNVLMKKRNPAASKGYDEIHPITKASNVFTSNGVSLEEMTANRDGYGIANSTGNTYSVTIAGGSTVLVEGLRVTIKVNVSSSGAASLNYNGLGARAIKKANGNDVTNLKGGSVYTLVFNGAAFILQGDGGDYGTAGAEDVLAPKTIGTENGLVSGTIVNRGDGGTVTPSYVDIVKPPGYYSSGIRVLAVNVLSDTVLSGTTIAGTSGSIPNRAGQTIYGKSALATGGGKLKILLETGYKGYFDDTTSFELSDSKAVPSSIMQGTRLFGLDGTATSDANATAADIKAGVVAYSQGQKLVGTYVQLAPKVATDAIEVNPVVQNVQYVRNLLGDPIMISVIFSLNTQGTEIKSVYTILIPEATGNGTAYPAGSGFQVNYQRQGRVLTLTSYNALTTCIFMVKYSYRA